MVTNVFLFADINLSSLHLGMLSCPSTVPVSAQLVVEGSLGGNAYVSRM